MPIVRMTVPLSGTRNGVDWPPVGGTLEVPAEEAAQLIGTRLAVAVEEVEAATVAPTESAAMKRPQPRKRTA